MINEILEKALFHALHKMKKRVYALILLFGQAIDIS